MTKYALPAFLATLAVALFCALLAGPYLAEWIADRARSYEYGYWYGYAEERRWPVGSFWLVLALTGFAVLGAAIMAMVWALYDATKPVKLDPVDERLRKVGKVVASVNKRDDLTSGEKEAFRTSAEALAKSSDGSSIKAAEAVGRENAVVAATDLAQEAEDELLRLLAHAAAIATPFSDAASKKIGKRRKHFADLDRLVSELEECEDLRKKIGTHCECGAKIDLACGCGEEGCEACKCAGCGGQGPRKGNHARLDVVWD
ncbi:hypothetical protein [Pyruvatibacter sp.]